MTQRMLYVLVLAAGVGGCEHESQPLPFSADAVQATTKTVSSAGAVMSTPAGASVQFPAGSMSTSTVVTLTPVAAPAAARPSGAAVSSGFQLEPAGTVLSASAGVDLKFDAKVDPARAWLASVVNVTPAGVREVGETRVDLATGLVRARIGELGTLSVVIPDPRAVYHVPRSGVRARAAASTLAATGTDSVVSRCGDAQSRCDGLTVSASSNLMGMVEDAAAVYPRIEGTLRIAGSGVSGGLTMSTAFRAQLKSGQSAENVVINGRIEPTAATRASETASELVFTQMLHHVAGSADSGSEAQQEIATLVVPKSGAAAAVTLTRTFQMRNSAGALEDASVSVTFPVQIHQ